VKPNGMRLYLCGGGAEVPVYNEAARFLRQHGYGVHSPVEAFGGDPGLPAQLYARFDVHLLLQVDGVVLLEGWQASRKALTEVAVARWLGLGAFELKETGKTLGEKYELSPAELPDVLEPWLWSQGRLKP